MTFHVAGLYRNVPTGTGYTELLPIADAELTTNQATSRFWSSKEARVFAAYAGGTSLTRARLYTPWRMPNEIRPINGAILPATVPGLGQWVANPMLIPATHELVFDVNQSNVAAQDIIGLVFLTTEGLRPRPAGEILTIRGDIAAAAPGVRTWSEVTVTWEYLLPPGDYAIVGSECISTNGIGHRWILETQNWRPGAISQTSLTTITTGYQMFGTLGNWGKFSAPVMPRLEVLCNAADATHTVFLQLVRI